MNSFGSRSLFSRGRRYAFLVLFISFDVTVPGWSQTAQAWLPARGEGSVSTTYQSVFGGDHYNTFGQKINFGPIRSHDLSGDIQYGITDRIAIGAELPFVFSKFTPDPAFPPDDHSARSTIDDGLYRSTFQDFRANVRYNVIRDPLVLTPFLEVVIPTHHYETFGHSSPGTDLHEIRIGADIARRLSPVLPRAYFDLQPTYSFVQSLANLNLDRVNIDLEVGYALHRRVTARAFGGIQKTQGGLEATKEVVDTAANEFFEIHDRAVRSHYSRAGAGVTFHLNENFNLFGAYLNMLSAKNSHAYATVAVGIDWRFQTRRSESVLRIPLPPK